jgi:hypothetical protein
MILFFGPAIALFLGFLYAVVVYCPQSNADRAAVYYGLL